MRRAELPWFCDCTKCNPEGRDKPLEYRGDSRHNDKGLRPWYVTKNLDRSYDASVSLEEMMGMTCTAGFNQALAGKKE